MSVALADPLARVLAPQGWPHASASATAQDDPGRFHALFGRDALITSLALLPERPELARVTLRVLAALQGERDDPETEEEPGRIVHEHWPAAPQRLRVMGWPVHDGAVRYYGSVDATPWFLVVLATLRDGALQRELGTAWRAAGAWLERALERGGGLLRHGPWLRGPLGQQGWRDTTDPANPETHGGGIVHEDGRTPAAPLADADSQAVAVAGMHALARLSGEERHECAAQALRERIAAGFDEETMALEPDGTRVRGAGSQLGWLLWADALPPDAAERAAARLVRDDLLTDWGLRTLSAEHPQFDPQGYHRGSVWPFDGWIGAAGLRAAGRIEEAERLRAGILEAMEELGGAPELYAVESDGPRRIPFANRVQAWSVGARWALEHGWDGRLAPRRRRDSTDTDTTKES